MIVYFVCHGNICRSVMAEFIFKSKTNKISCDSFAVSNEEEGNDIYYKAKETLLKHNIPFTKHYAKRINYDDCCKADIIFIMDKSNYNLIKNIALDNMYKVQFLNNEIEDPWYTNNFDKVYYQIEQGIDIFLREIKND